jgi:hypothetical protein
MIGITSILREAWNTATNTQDKRDKIQALSLAKECYSMKLDLLTNARVVDATIRFVEWKSVKPKKIEKDVQQQIQGNDKLLSTINQTF